MYAMRKLLYTILSLLAMEGFGQEKSWTGKFEQLDQLLPTPNSYRSSSGAPGPSYWQQQADYEIAVSINDETQVLTGTEKITYFNHAPESMSYLWLQLDQNINADKSMTRETSSSVIRDSVAAKFLATTVGALDYKGGFTIKSVRDALGNELPKVINYTMMRIDLPKPLRQGEQVVFTVDWSYNINDRMKFSDRGGMEYFPGDKNYIYTMAQWFPRMCVFDDYEGWQNKQFLGAGEFALTFGNYRV